MPLPVAQRRDFDGQARGSHSGLEELDQRQEPLDATELGYSDSNHEEGDAREWEDVDEEVEELPVPDEHLRFRPPTKTSAPFTFAANETGEQKLRCILRGINAAPSTIHKATGKPKVKVSKRTKTLTGNEDAFVALYDEFGDLEIFEKLNTRQELPKLSRQPRELSQCSYPVNYLALNKLRHRRRASRLLRAGRLVNYNGLTKNDKQTSQTHRREARKHATRGVYIASSLAEDDDWIVTTAYPDPEYFKIKERSILRYGTDFGLDADLLVRAFQPGVDHYLSLNNEDSTMTQAHLGRKSTCKEQDDAQRSANHVLDKGGRYSLPLLAPPHSAHLLPSFHPHARIYVLSRQLNASGSERGERHDHLRNAGR